MPYVAVIIPTLRGGVLLNACLLALGQQTFRDFEVIVINNGPPLSRLRGAPLWYPIRIISPGENIGFGGAINLGLSATDARLIATLNDDTEPDPQWLEALVGELEADSRTGMCASRIRLFDQERLDSAGMLICLDGNSKQRSGLNSPEVFACPEDVLLPSACAALYRRAMLDEIGLFDADFFLYCEDTDLGLRARWAGWRCRYAPGASVRHHYSATAAPFSPLKAYFVERNRLWVAIKNFPLVLLPLLPLVSLARYYWQLQAIKEQRGAAAGFMRTGQTVSGALTILLRAWWGTLIRLPQLLRKRSGLQRIRRMASADFVRLLHAHRITARDLARA